jgi:hypothetical protein
MAIIHSETLVLRGVPAAVYGVAAGLERNGSAVTGLRTPTMPLSLTRHLFAGYPRSGADPDMRLADAAERGAAQAAKRAGRPGSPAGVLGSRNPAITAGRAIQSGWTRSGRGACPAPADWRLNTQALAAGRSSDKALSGHPTIRQRKPLQVVLQRHLQRGLGGEQRGEPARAFAQAGGVPTAFCEPGK